MLNDHREEKKIDEKNVMSEWGKPYHKPLLEELGDLRTLTLGGSLGIGDFSGDPDNELPFP